jgi:hypothetical protein
MKRFLSTFFAAAMILACGIAPSHAAPIPYVNVPMDTPNSAANAVVTSLNAVLPSAQYVATCSGTTTATCVGIRFTVSITGLTTAAGVTSASMVVTDTSVTASSVAVCQASGYGGTGNPQPVNVVPTASTLTFQVQNTHASAALNATVPVSCMIYN